MFARPFLAQREAGCADSVKRKLNRGVHAHCYGCIAAFEKYLRVIAINAGVGWKASPQQRC
jgi:hypothetical protein